MIRLLPKQFTFLFFALLVSPLILTLLAACQTAAAVGEPPEIRFGEDICDHCFMIINEPRFAASYVTEMGETRRFDDIGNMMFYHIEHDEDVAAFWVHDYDTEEWLRAENAHYVVSPDIYTPMASGIVAFQDAGSAERLAAEHSGQLFDFTELIQYYASGEVSHDHHHHDHSGHNDDHDHSDRHDDDHDHSGHHDDRHDDHVHHEDEHNH